MEKPLKIQEDIYLLSRITAYHVDKVLKHCNFGNVVQCTDTETGEIFAVKCVRKKFAEKYRQEKQLGSGCFGTVLMCRVDREDKRVAVKIVLNQQSAQHELEAMKYLIKHDSTQKYIPELIEAFEYNNLFCFVYELLDQSLLNLMERTDWTPLNMSEIRYIAKQLLETLDFLQQVNITHTDIKPDNIMLVNHDSEPFRVKLIDFGLAVRECQYSEEELIPSISYKAPEIYLGNPCNESIDTWGVGCVLAFLFIGRNLCPEDEYEAMRIFPEHFWRLKTPQEYEQFTGKKIMKINPVFDELDSLDDMVKMLPEMKDPAKIKDFKAFVDFLKKLLHVNPAERIVPADALGHTFITMGHLADAGNSQYVTLAHEIMTGRKDKCSNSFAPTGETRYITSPSKVMSPADKSCENSKQGLSGGRTKGDGDMGKILNIVRK
uniref:Protein kinase domain-containing protein n=1 Tax=Nothobranchius furzeri TaxID=105023 RepID=A0A8C6L7W8_NOTFU